MWWCTKIDKYEVWSLPSSPSLSHHQHPACRCFKCTECSVLLHGAFKLLIGIMVEIIKWERSVLIGRCCDGDDSLAVQTFVDLEWEILMWFRNRGVHGPRGPALLRTVLPREVRGEVCLLPAVHFWQGTSISSYSQILAPIKVKQNTK